MNLLTWFRHLLVPLALVLVCSRPQAQTTGEPGVLDGMSARAFANALTQALESKALRPRDQSEYDSATAALYRIAEGEPSTIDRRTVYDASRKLLNTLDTDGHTILLSREQLSSWGV